MSQRVKKGPCGIGDGIAGLPSGTTGGSTIDASPCLTGNEESTVGVAEKSESKRDYSWIKVKKYVDDPTKTWEERYRALEKHHEKETTFLIAEVSRLRRDHST